MTEIFYQLLTNVSSTYYALERTERRAMVRRFIVSGMEKSATSIEKNEMDVSIFHQAKEILEEVDSVILEKSTENEANRKELAEKCLQLRATIFEHVSERLADYDYRSISNADFAALKKSILSDYLKLALQMAECRGRLTAYLLRHYEH